MKSRAKSQEYYEEVAARRRAMRETLIFGKSIEPQKKPTPLRVRVREEEKEMTTYPMQLGMTLRRFRWAHRFTCTMCETPKTSKFNAISLTGIICNPCYGKALALGTK